jgi:aryl-alcohol dehydrogenase-like predicted oxidoreductase
MEHRTLGRRGPSVSVLSLGSWRTFETMTRDAGLAVMRAARDAGITFLDDARYDDPTGTAPIPTGYSEVVFGELFREAGWPRDRTVVANKLWWEFWPQQGAVEELQLSLARMKFEHVDLIYAERPPDGAALEEILEGVAEVLDAGLARHWGVLNWSAELTAACIPLCDELGLAHPVATQLPYNLLRRSIVEDPRMQGALAAGAISVVASAVLDGGALTGKYSGGSDVTGRLAARRDAPAVQRAIDAATRLSRFAEHRGTTAAAMAMAFALRGPHVGSVLFGATAPEQIAENAAALRLAARLDDGDWAALNGLFPPLHA